MTRHAHLRAAAEMARSAFLRLTGIATRPEMAGDPEELAEADHQLSEARYHLAAAKETT